VAGGLSDEISISGSVQDDLGNSHYKGVCFRARGISNAENVLAVSAFYCFLHVIMGDLREDLSARPWREHGSIWISYLRL